MITVAVLRQTPFAMRSGYLALVMTYDAHAGGEVGLQALPVEAEIGADAWVVRYAEIVIEKESVDWFHEIERKEKWLEKKLFPVLRPQNIKHRNSVQ